MREIKFRAWDNVENKYFKPTCAAYKGELRDLSICLGGDILRRSLEYCAEHESRFTNQYIIEQYTGLKDKNDKEIYEGDILKTKDGYICFVVWSILAWVVESPGSQSQDLELESFYNECEVIGNIHENPELL